MAHWNYGPKKTIDGDVWELKYNTVSDTTELLCNGKSVLGLHYEDRDIVCQLFNEFYKGYVKNGQEI